MNFCELLFGVLVYSVICFCNPLSNATGNLKSGQSGGYIVVAGGFDYYSTLRQSVFLLNIHTRTWSNLADLPTPTQGSQLFYADGKLFSAGGSSVPTSFLMYNSTVPSWKSLTDLIQQRLGGPCGAILADSLYLIGGSESTAETLVMNPFNFPTWAPGAELQQARWACGAATLGNNIYTCGTQSTNADGKTCEKYDPTANSWSFIASMNDYRMGQILVSMNGYLFAVGGNTLGTAERYDPATNAWTYVQPVSVPNRVFSVAVTDGQLIYLMGGCADTSADCSGGPPTNSVEVYIPEIDEWVALPSMPEALGASAIAYLPKLP